MISIERNKMKMINAGDLYITCDDSDLQIIAYNFERPWLADFRMKPKYAFVVIETNVIYKEQMFAKILMSNTGQFQLLKTHELKAFLFHGLIKLCE